MRGVERKREAGRSLPESIRLRMGRVVGGAGGPTMDMRTIRLGRRRKRPQAATAESDGANRKRNEWERVAANVDHRLPLSLRHARTPARAEPRHQTPFGEDGMYTQSLCKTLAVAAMLSGAAGASAETDVSGDLTELLTMLVDGGSPQVETFCRQEGFYSSGDDVLTDAGTVLPYMESEFATISDAILHPRVVVDSDTLGEREYYVESEQMPVTESDLLREFPGSFLIVTDRWNEPPAESASHTAALDGPSVDVGAKYPMDDVLWTLNGPNSLLDFFASEGTDGLDVAENSALANLTLDTIEESAGHENSNTNRHGDAHGLKGPNPTADVSMQRVGGLTSARRSLHTVDASGPAPGENRLINPFAGIADAGVATGALSGGADLELTSELESRGSWSGEAGPTLEDFRTYLWAVNGARWSRERSPSAVGGEWDGSDGPPNEVMGSSDRTLPVFVQLGPLQHTGRDAMETFAWREEFLHYRSGYEGFHVDVPESVLVDGTEVDVRRVVYYKGTTCDANFCGYDGVVWTSDHMSYLESLRELGTRDRLEQDLRYQLDQTGPTILADWTPVGDVSKLITGRHPLTGEEESRRWAALAVLAGAVGGPFSRVLGFARTGFFSPRRLWWPGDHKIPPRWFTLFGRRGWTPEKVDDVIEKGKKTTVIDKTRLDVEKFSKGGYKQHELPKAYQYTEGGTGHYVVRRESDWGLIQISDRTKGKAFKNDKAALSIPALPDLPVGAKPVGPPKIPWDLIEQLKRPDVPQW